MLAQKILGPDPANTNLTAFMWTNVGRVANKGWEFSGNYQVGRFILGGTFSITNAMIKDSTGSYLLPQIKLAPGTKMPNIPEHTAGLMLNYNFYKLFRKADKGVVSLNVTWVDGIKYQDYRKYSLDIAYGRTAYVPGFFGDQVENSVFRVGLYLDYLIVPDFKFFCTGF